MRPWQPAVIHLLPYVATVIGALQITIRGFKDIHPLLRIVLATILGWAGIIAWRFLADTHILKALAEWEGSHHEAIYGNFVAIYVGWLPSLAAAIIVTINGDEQQDY